MQLHSVNFMGRFPLASKCTASQSTLGDKQCQVSARARVEGSSGEQVEQKTICIFRLPKTYTLRGKPRVDRDGRQRSTRPPGGSLLTRKDTAFTSVLLLQEIYILSFRQEVVF